MENRPKFNRRQETSFQTVVKERVANWFKENNLSPYANRTMKIKTYFYLGLYLSLWTLILSNHFQGFFLMVLWSLFGVTQGLMGFNIVHDALHGAYSSSSRVNKLLGYLFDWNGESSLVWKLSHNGMHHTYTNITGFDGDIDKSTLLRLSPHDPWISFNRYQQYYTPFLYSMVSIPWVFINDYKLMYQAWKNNQATKSDVQIFFFFKVINFFLMIILPFLVLSVPAWQIILGNILMHMSAGFVIALVFQLAHLVEGVEFPLPDEEGSMQEEWAVHEMKTTSNFAIKNRPLSWLLGGLNFQVEHHLFPQVCHVYYPHISPIIKSTAFEFGIPYHEKETLTGAIFSHFRLLKKLGENPQVQLSQEEGDFYPTSLNPSVKHENI